MGMKTRTISRHELDAEPYRIWNAFVDLLATEDFHDLVVEQRPAHLVFWYMSEVENGGHLQYFENHGTNRLAATIEALSSLGAICHAKLLQAAGALWLSCERHSIQTVEEYCESALEGEFSVLDSRFQSCLPTLNQCLESCLKRNQSLFVTVT